MIFFKDQTNIAISFCTAYAELEVCPTCTVQCLPIFLQYFFRYYTENRTPKVKQEPWDYVVHLPKLAITIYILLLSGKVNHKETHLNWQFFFFSSKFQPNIKRLYLQYYWFPFSILYAWQNFWVQIKTKAT